MHVGYCTPGVTHIYTYVEIFGFRLERIKAFLPKQSDLLICALGIVSVSSLKMGEILRGSVGFTLFSICLYTFSVPKHYDMGVQLNC